MLEELWRRKLFLLYLTLWVVTDQIRHMGFEVLAMRNIDAVLKGHEPLTPVNKHLIVVEAAKVHI